MKYPKLREIRHALRALVTRAYTTKFPYKPHIPFTSFRGKPYFYEEDCIGCTACVSVCPTGALSFKNIKIDSKYKRLLKVRWDICIECGQCQLNCPTTKGIILSNEFDISSTDGRSELFQLIEKEMVLCELCNEPIACFDHIKWTIDKLGPLYVSNSSLITFKQRQILVSSDLPKSTKETLRSDRFRLVCPQCRRKAVLAS